MFERISRTIERMKVKELIERLEEVRLKTGDNADVYISPYADCYKIPYSVDCGKEGKSVFIDVM